MNGKTLTIKELMYVLEISRPTALILAQEVGSKGPGRNDKWRVPAEFVRDILNAKKASLNVQFARLEQLTA